MFESTITLNHLLLDAITIKSIFEISGLLWSSRMLSMLRLMRFYFLNSKFFQYFIFTIGLNIQHNILIYIFSKKLQIDHCVMLEWTSYNFGKLRKYLLPLLHILCTQQQQQPSGATPTVAPRVVEWRKCLAYPYAGLYI